MAPLDPVCPRCGSKRIVLGELTRGRTIGPVEALGFRAFAARLSSLRIGARVDPGMAACGHCGLVWGQVQVGSLLNHLEQHASTEVLRWLRSERETPL
ncbi:MAG: hypothetical protein M3Z05_09280 [Gemmatimonadota bacterium]|nr:hypothetical protein [Gemmatimonadota bacterium]